MVRLVSVRLMQTVIVAFIVSVIVFLLMHVAPGDPVNAIYGEQNVSAVQKAALRHQLGLDLPLWRQYADFVLHALQGDLGNSIFRSASVGSLVRPALMATVELTVASLVVAVAIGFPVAVISALKQNSIYDRAGSALALFGISMPSFWLGIICILVFSVHLGILPTGGRLATGLSVRDITGIDTLDAVLSGNWIALRSALEHLVLPAVTLGAAMSATLARVLRASLIEAKNQEFVEALRARGMSEVAVVRHMLRNSLPPAVIMMGIKVGSLLGGAIVIEVVFSWPGLGRLIVTAISARDYPLIQGGVLVMAVLFVLVNLATDLIHGVLDPRVRQGKKAGV
ncbi:ABC transporter permease [Jatrophihabitans cynanchi]|uniref:ABC transporter permease n=1 Tax=Jatrophihabitans cynanchi TaxID=2944128 RepID=A0ABY7JS38_9ACTN|nr:ABC transporter permease [Jatrophihabitans sp. SB3-54]WAX55158.1 ABC transporter permease [Jatrophihabitans sp. SB3-54]